MYRAPSVMEVRTRVTAVVNDLFTLFMDDARLLPEEWRAQAGGGADAQRLARTVSDYIAGMTDRFALDEHARLTGKPALPRRAGV
jgi:dGTPase